MPWFMWLALAAVIWLVQLVASDNDWPWWRVALVIAMFFSLAIGLIRFVKWVWLWG